METRFDSAHDAERAFYAAFARADVEAMMAVWADDDGIVCIHPLGERLEGRAAIHRSWRGIFTHGPRLEFRVGEVRTVEDERLIVRVVYEHIWFADTHTFQGSAIATNAYRLTETGWRMVLHHASPLPAHEQPPLLH
jgi:uncharacterized protein (TIGR02246 family)